MKSSSLNITSSAKFCHVTQITMMSQVFDQGGLSEVLYRNILELTKVCVSTRVVPIIDIL